MITLLTCSVTMSVLAIIYMALTPLLAKRYSERGRYYAWLIIVIGLIIPFRPQFDNAIVKVVVPSEITTPITKVGNGTPVAIPDVNAIIPSALPSTTWWTWWQIAAAIWLFGMVVFLTYHIIKHLCFTKIANRWSERITDEQALTLFQSLKSEMEISKRLELYLCPCIGSPMMIGFLNSRILLPIGDFAQDELHFILKHEIIHNRRNDLWYKLLVIIATAVHWFNPFIYLIAKAIDMQCELSCDFEVVRSTDADTRQYYSETIISVVKYQSKLKTALSTNFYGGKNGMKKRIFSIMDASKKKAGLALLCSMLIFTAGTGMAFAASAKPNSAPVTNIPATSQQQGTDQPTSSQAEQDSKNQYTIYEQYGLIYNAKDDKLYYKDQIVRYFVDRLNNGQGVLCMWAYDFNGTIDLYAVRNNVGLEGDLTGVAAYSQEDFNLRTKEIEAEQNNTPDYDIMTFRFKKDNAPESLQLWIRQCEDDIFDFSATQQNGRYYIYVRGETEFGFSVSVDGDEASMQISNINGAKSDGYALFSVPLYKGFTVTYNGASKSFLQ